MGFKEQVKRGELSPGEALTQLEDAIGKEGYIDIPNRDKRGAYIQLDKMPRAYRWLASPRAEKAYRKAIKARKKEEGV